ncbi:MAG: hypothetical protein KAG61_09365 [Bacteriovoracaceae bacterium]|nr:hypothetical protein [Bacteriovoracaceae bacterium]
MKKLVTLFVLFTSISALANCEDSRRFKNCMIVTNNKQICNMMICSNFEKNSRFETETAVDPLCFEALLDEIGPTKAAEACPSNEYDLEIDYDAPTF